MSTSRQRPMRFPQPSSCSANWRSPTALSRSTPCIAKKTFEAAAQAQARVIIQLKDNQPSLLHNVEAVCASRNPTGSDTEVTTGRGRHETRTAEVFSANTAVAGTEWKPLIKAIVR